MAQETNFVEEFILEILKNSGFDKLPAEARAEMLPQFTVEAQRRIGVALLPQLDKAAAEEFVKMTQADNNDPKAWWQFWEKHVPNFKELAGQALTDYAQELKNVLQK